MVNWIANNFIYAILAGVALIIIGAGVAFKADNKFGYVVLAGGCLLIFYVMRVHGLV